MKIPRPLLVVLCSIPLWIQGVRCSSHSSEMVEGTITAFPQPTLTYSFGPSTVSENIPLPSSPLQPGTTTILVISSPLSSTSSTPAVETSTTEPFISSTTMTSSSVQTSVVTSATSSMFASTSSVPAPPPTAVPTSTAPSLSTSIATPPTPTSSALDPGIIAGIVAVVVVLVLVLVVGLVLGIVLCRVSLNRKGAYATKEDDVRETTLLKHNASIRSVKDTYAKQETEYYL